MSFYCGIDLGTTNSLIGRGDKMFSGLVSSSVDVNTKKQCPRDVYGDNIVSSYKVDMTTGPEGGLPIACSAVILRDLANKASAVSGRNVTDVVVSVPAKFTHTQREAVCRAVEKADLVMRGLINEPTAAAIYVCRDMKDLVIVYDLGGGTFDVTVIDSRAGSYYVLASDGRILAGDDFDKAIVDDIFETKKVKVRHRTGENRKAITAKVRQAKEELQKSKTTQFIEWEHFNEEPDIPYELTVDKYCTIMEQVFAETINLTKRVIAKSLGDLESPKIVFVGGSTACPFLKAWVKQETGLEEVTCDDAPDYIVAKGVALYAEMLENGTAEREVEDVTKRLCIEDKIGQSIVIIDRDTTIPVEQTITVQNEIASDKLEIKLFQGDSIMCSDNDYIGTLMYEYGCQKKAGEGIVEITVKVDRDGRITLTGTDILTGASQNVELVMR